MSTDYLMNEPKEAEGVLTTRVWPLFDEHLPTADPYRRLAKKYEPKEQLSMSSFEGFINAMVLCDALKAAGKDLSRDKFVSALESMHDLDLGLGPKYVAHFKPAQHAGLGSQAIYFNVMKNGRLVTAGEQDWK